MSLEAKIVSVIRAIGADIKALTVSLINKQDILVDGANVKTINGQSILGSGNINVSGGSGNGGGNTGSPLTYGLLVDGATSIVSPSMNQRLDSYASASYRTSKYLIQAVWNGQVHSVELMLTHAGASVYASQYSVLCSESELFTVDANLISGQVMLFVTPLVEANASFPLKVDFIRTSVATRGTDVVISDIVGDLLTQSGTEDLMLGSGIVDLMSSSAASFEISGDLLTLTSTEDLMLGSGAIDLLTN